MLARVFAGFKSLSVFIALSLLIGCIPSYSNVFLAPQVTGQIIELQTLQPLAVIRISHLNNPESVVLSDQQGRFELGPVVTKQFVMLMPAHAFKEYPVKIIAGEQQVIAFARASLLMRYLEVVALPTIIIDSQPGDITHFVKSGWQSYSWLKSQLESEGLLNHCDLYLAEVALASLNTSRKLLEKSIQNEQPPQNHSELSMPQLLEASYLNTQEIWEYFQGSCERTLANYQDLDVIFAAISEESREFLISH